MTINYNITIGAMIAQDFRTAAVFLGYQIDLMTEREKTIETICKDKNISLLHLMNNLNNILFNSINRSIDYSLWPLMLLTDLIIIHQRYVTDNLPVIRQFLDRLSEIHEGHDQNIIDFCARFNRSAELLTMSLQKPISTISYSIKILIDELNVHTNSFLSIVGRINKYVPTENAYGSYIITLDLLAEAQSDLFKIIGLQTILYKKVMDLEMEIPQI